MIWLDAHLSPRMARWIRDNLEVEAKALRDLGMRDAEDEEIFEQARREGVVLLTKDKDFAELVKRLGTPPHVIWLRCGNTSEARLKVILRDHLREALDWLEAGESLVEVKDG